MNLLPNEIIIHTLNNLSYEELITVSEVNKAFNILIKIAQWDIIVNFKKYEHFYFILNHYHFSKFCLKQIRGHIYDNDIISLKHAFSINMYGCYHITDFSIQFLKECVEINLDDCFHVTDEGIKVLDKCKKLSIRHCPRISNEMISKLKEKVMHLFHDKCKVNRPVQLLTRQPPEGRSKRGGLRNGEIEEKNADVSFLREIMINE